ncbi:hypothetical protein [Nocardioides sp. cx-173]|uniref:hypothetical protein n=1 Tax=Nocardioides sp. cx-173 TaxID=2898796 RepID=UPI001E623059|nr:hypothetical protein [Nocardioides sp. cx-173]MCD4524103.1 hypothetical protein [Nocardioides sp. cx-173]UGB41500.1 hypothetical protein LQ940_19320 [Nocardioides sp. cx-173]
MPTRLTRPAVAAVALLLLAGCGGGGGDDGAAGPNPASGAAAALTAPKAAPSAPAQDVAAYRAALEQLDADLDQFTAAYSTALGANDHAAVVKAAQGLGGAIADFDAEVRGLDLSAVRPLVDRLLRLDAEFVAMLEEVPRARTGAKAARIVEMLPFQDYVVAYEAVADAL